MRLLDVCADSNEGPLTTTNALPHCKKYATLSHCWDSSLSRRLPVIPMSIFSFKIPFDLLSKTFRNAILAARRLGLRYLWLCPISTLMSQTSVLAGQTKMLCEVSQISCLVEWRWLSVHTRSIVCAQYSKTKRIGSRKEAE